MVRQLTKRKLFTDPNYIIDDILATIGYSIVAIFIIIFSFGVAGCYAAILSSDILLFLIMIAVQLIIIIYVIDYYLEPENFWYTNDLIREKFNEIKKYCRRRFRKL